MGGAVPTPLAAHAAPPFPKRPLGNRHSNNVDCMIVLLDVSFSRIDLETQLEHAGDFYINGQWVSPKSGRPFAVINPATAKPVATIRLGGVDDVETAVKAARKAFASYSATPVQERVALMRRIASVYLERIDEIAATITAEMGAPLWFAKEVQAVGVANQFRNAAEILSGYEFEYMQGSTRIVREPIGVCGLITAWNWPLNLIAGKLAPALAAGCTVVLKPSEFAPLSSVLLAEVMDAAGVPPGVFNLVQGDGPTVGNAISSHPDIDMVSFTGSTRGGVAVAKAAADTVKRVHQELGGKSAHLLLPGSDLEDAVLWGINRSYMNCGQSCEAPTRMFVHRSQADQAAAIAGRIANGIKVGDPLAADTKLGPLVNRAQFDRVQMLVQSGVDEGATLVCGGPGMPDGLSVGNYVRPTVFADVKPEMTIAREEVFGPVLSMFTYDSEEEAVAMANDSVYGLAAYVHGPDIDSVRGVASKLRAGRVYLNGAPSDINAPFGGYKQSGNGRQNGVFGFEEYLETKAILGF